MKFEVIRKLLSGNLSKNIYGRQIIHRLITYPLTALCTFFNFWIMSQLFNTTLFNLYLVLWMLVGVSQILEYALGVQIMNRVILNGYTQKILAQVKVSIGVLGCLVLAIGIACWFSPLRNVFEQYLYSKDKTLVDMYPSVLLVFLIVLFFTGLSQLMSRVLIGLARYTVNQYVSMIGYLLVTLILYLTFSLEIELTFSAALAISLSPLAVVFIPLAFIIWTIRVPESSSENLDNSRYTGLSYGVVYTLVSVLASYVLFLPRLDTDLRDRTLSQFLLIFTVIGMFMNIASSVSQLMWRSNLKRPSGWNGAKKLYLVAAQLNLLILPLFCCVMAITLKLFSFQINLSYLLQICLAGYLNLFFTNLHLVSSSQLTSKKDLTSSLGFLVLHSVGLMILLNVTKLDTVVSSLILITIISLIFAHIPTALYLKLRIS
jgi:hypothetical protein